ncbi:MAG: PAS domain S-box protein, partial [Acidobacteriota bacterium]|nr:PAS domain S-box protein [Acidobacteriota bacterium]
EELLHRNFADLYGDRDERRKLIQLLGEKGAVHNAEIVLRRKDGKKLYCVTSGFAIRDGSGKPVRLQGIITDVTERREIERKLHREQEFGRQLIECFPDLIAVMDRQGRFTFVSERIREMLGVAPQQYMGRLIGSATHPEDREPLLQMVREIVAGRSNYSQIESRVRRADGEWRTLRTSASPMFDEEGRITGVVASVRDLTEAHAAEQQNLQKEKFAAMGQMMAGAAHELNNPLTAILGVSDLLRERAADDTTRRQIDLILQQARRAAAIIQNLLAFSRPAVQGRTALQLQDLLREVLAAQGPSLAAKNISVKFDPPAGIPPVEADRRLLSQVFSNLITNAQQSISSVRDRGAVEISLQSVNNLACVTIADDGPGVPAENKSKLFDPFFTTKRPGGGSGLGLTIALAVVKDHGGTIEVGSMPGGGASFQVRLPAAATAAKQTEPAIPAAKAPKSAAGALAGHTVLIIDDEESIREIVQEGLLAHAMKVHSVSSCEKALDYLQSNDCDVVICDFNLPGMSGGQFYERCAAGHRSSRMPQFVFMTGELVDSEPFDRLREQGASVLQKPFDVGDLTTLLTGLLQLQPQQR